MTVWTREDLFIYVLQYDDSRPVHLLGPLLGPGMGNEDVARKEFQSLCDGLVPKAAENLLAASNRPIDWRSIIEEVLRLLEERGFYKFEPAQATYWWASLRTDAPREYYKQNQLLGPALARVLERSAVFDAKETQARDERARAALQRTYEYEVEESACQHCGRAITHMLRPLTSEDQGWYMSGWVHDDTYRNECSNAAPSAPPVPVVRRYKRTHHVAGKFVRVEADGAHADARRGDSGGPNP